MYHYSVNEKSLFIIQFGDYSGGYIDRYAVILFYIIIILFYLMLINASLFY